MTRCALLALLAAVVLPPILPLHAQTTGDRPMTQPLTATEARNKALVEAGFAAWSAGTGSPFELLRPFKARMSQGLKPTVRSLNVDGDSVIIFFDASGVARDGKAYVNTYAWFWELRDGRVVKAHAFYDSIAFNDLWRRVSPTP